MLKRSGDLTKLSNLIIEGKNLNRFYHKKCCFVFMSGFSGVIEGLDNSLVEFDEDERCQLKIIEEEKGLDKGFAYIFKGKWFYFDKFKNV